ncbi:MAG TPA: hypothetical protein VN642_11545, partial [Dongiaceae bacterium]|nr:hypothetical protein [Dongiaceae bacterium]
MSDRVVRSIPSRARGRAGVHLAILLAAFFLAACSAVVDESDRPLQDKTTTLASEASTSLTSEASNREGAETARLVAAAEGGTGSSTITARLLPNEPVKEIAAREVLLAGSPQEPTLEIAGAGTGHIVICKLVLRKVDARELVAVNVAIKSLSAVNTFVPSLNIVNPAPLDIVVDPALVV